MVEHFRQKVRHKIGGKAKAMVVTSSRLHAVRYKQAFDTYIRENGYSDMHVLVAARDIRKMAAAGLSLAGLVPPLVEEYIRKEGLYRPARPGIA